MLAARLAQPTLTPSGYQGHPIRKVASPILPALAVLPVHGLEGAHGAVRSLSRRGSASRRSSFSAVERSIGAFGRASTQRG